MADEAPASASSPEPASLSELALLFLRLGLTAFGGPAAHIALMESEVVRRLRWLSHERFLDLLGAANLLPGPSSTELAIYIGYERSGWRGLLLGGTCFILPAALIVTGLAWIYVRAGSVPQVGAVLYGIKPVVIAIVVQALWNLAPKAIRGSKLLAAVGLLAGVAVSLGTEPLTILLSSGAACSLAHRLGTRPTGDAGVLWPPAAMAAAASAGATSVSLFALFLTFIKIGAVVFGSGYVLLAFLRADLVDRLHWLTESQLLDAVAIGQVTPGPVFTTATFIGYVVAGVPGALVATLGIFLPGFLLVAATRPIVSRVRRSPLAGAFLDGVNVASLALMAVVIVQLARSAVVDWVTAGLAMAGAVLLLRFKVSSTWLIAGAALVGVTARALR